MQRTSAKHRAAAIVQRIADALPPALVSAIGRQPTLRRLAARAKPLVVGDAPLVTTLKVGHLAGSRLAVTESSMRYYWLRGHDEPFVEQALAELAAPGTTAIDVGAHIGIETVLLARSVGQSGSVLSVEPDPRNLELLRINCALNELANVTVVPAAASAQAGAVSFVSDDDSTTSHVDIGGAFETQRGGGTVEAVTLDALVAEHVRGGRVSVIKVDVEGHEAEVLRGAGTVLGAGDTSVVVEIHSEWSLNACLQILASHGLHVVRYSNEPVPPDSSGAVPFPRRHLIASPN